LIVCPYNVIDYIDLEGFYMLKNIKKFLLLIAFAILLFFPSMSQANPNDYTVEGDMTRFTTGNAYPKEIQLTGYDSRNDTLYINLAFEGGLTYDYTVNVFHGVNTSLWGTSTDSGITDLALGNYEVSNKAIVSVPANTDLELSYRIVATVTNYTP
jgi:hypothetical protein